MHGKYTTTTTKEMKRLIELCLLTLGLVLISCVKEDPPTVRQIFASRASGNVMSCWYGIRSNNLCYVVFQNGRWSGTNRVEGALTIAPDGSQFGTQWLKLSNGSKTNLDNSYAIFERHDTNTLITTAKLSVKETDLLRYVESAPQTFSIKGLYNYLGKQTPKIIELR